MVFLEIFLYDIRGFYKPGGFKEPPNVVVEFKVVQNSGRATRSVRSTVAKRTLSPAWNERLIVECNNPARVDTVLEIVVHNRSRFSEVTTGEAQVTLTSIPMGTEKEYSVELEKTGSGKISFKIMYAYDKKDVQVLKSGHLEKTANIEGSKLGWKGRWFVLKEDGLYWYPSEDSTDAIGALHNLADSKFLDDIPGHYLAFGIKSTNKTYYLKAKLPHERSDWLIAFKQASDKLAALHKKPDAASSTASQSTTSTQSSTPSGWNPAMGLPPASMSSTTTSTSQSSTPSGWNPAMGLPPASMQSSYNPAMGLPPASMQTASTSSQSQPMSRDSHYLSAAQIMGTTESQSTGTGSKDTKQEEQQPQEKVITKAEVKGWGVDELIDYFKTLNLKKDYSEPVRDNNITGEVFLCLNDDMLKGDLGVNILGDRIILKNAIAKFA